jgi:hypothetical protein
VTRDITEGRATRAIAVDLGIATTNTWQNTGDSYDCAIAGIPFLTAISDERLYQRATSPFRKQQFDSQRDPGEQSLSTWWLRSQSSFHAGEGILFYDPLANPYSTTIASNSYRIKESYGVDIWTQGQVTLLHDVTQGHVTTEQINNNGRPSQHLRSIKYNGTDGVLLHDGYDIDRISVSGTVEHWVDNAAGQDKVYSLCDDGKFAYWITNDSSTGKLEINKKLLTAASTTAPTAIATASAIAVTNAVIDYVKQRLVFTANNFVYEMPSSATNFNQAVLAYTHPSTSFVFSSITESGTAIYIAGYEGIKSSIFRFSLDATTGSMPVLTSAITAAEMPVGETINKIYEYLGYMMIGTNKGIRVAEIKADGSLTYGPLIVELEHGCYDFAARDRFVWCASGVKTIEPGLIRIDLSNEIETLRFAYANDLFYDTPTHNITTAVAFFGETEQLAFCTAAEIAGRTVVNKALSGGTVSLTTATAHGLTAGDIIWVEGVDAAINSGAPFTGSTIVTTPSTTSLTYTTASTATVTSQAVTSSTALVKRVGNMYGEHATRMRSDGYVQTGLIRYNTLEPKNFKRIVGQGSFTFGSMSIQTVDVNGNIYDNVSYDVSIGNPEVVITQPAGSQDAMGLRFRLYRDATDNTKSPTFKGYQLKAVPATPRTRIISIPLMNFDSETDKYNSTLGYEGRAIERLAALENAESSGDVVTFQDFRTGEIRQCLIEEVKFTNTSPPDKRFTGYGGIINLTIRTV